MKYLLLLILPILTLAALAQESAPMSSPGVNNPSRTVSDAAACRRAYGIGDPKAEDSLEPLINKIPIPLEDGLLTETMLVLDERPDSRAREALRFYYEAELACTQASAKVVTESTHVPYPVDPATGIPKGWEKRLDRIRLLQDGKLTFGEFNAQENQMRADYLAVLNKVIAAEYADRIKAWLEPFKSKYPSNSPWWAFYDDALKIARDVQLGNTTPQAGDRLIEERVSALNQTLEAAKAKVITLKCSINRDFSEDHKDVTIVVDLNNSTVNGRPAKVTDDEISWSADKGIGTATISRINGFISIAMWRGHCARDQ